MLAHSARLQGVHEGVQLLGGAERAHVAVPVLQVDGAALPGHAPPVAAVLAVPAQRLPPYAAVLQRALKLLLPPACTNQSASDDCRGLTPCILACLPFSLQALLGGSSTSVHLCRAAGAGSQMWIARRLHWASLWELKAGT